VRVLQKHPRPDEPAPVCAAGLRLAYLPQSFLHFFPLTAFVTVIPFFYLATNLIASLYTAYKRGWEHLPLLPLSLPFCILAMGWVFGRAG